LDTESERIYGCPHPLGVTIIDSPRAYNFAVYSKDASKIELLGLRLIAEPWGGDTASYMMGRSYPGRNWHQCNDHFRDTVRSFVKGDVSLIDELKRRLYGSTDLFPDDIANACRRWQSINYIASHDGPNLRDLVSFTNDSFRSWNCGFEGVNSVPADIFALRKQQIRNMFCLLMLSNGTPMFVAGDEFMQTQRGCSNSL